VEQSVERSLSGLEHSPARTGEPVANGLAGYQGLARVTLAALNGHETATPKRQACGEGSRNPLPRPRLDALCGLPESGPRWRWNVDELLAGCGLPGEPGALDCTDDAMAGADVWKASEGRSNRMRGEARGMNRLRARDEWGLAVARYLPRQGWPRTVRRTVRLGSSSFTTKSEMAAAVESAKMT